MKILLTLPFSGRAFGGGLSVFNAELARAFAAAGHSTKVLTMQLPEELLPQRAEHGGAELIVIKNAESAAMKGVQSGGGQKLRNRLYALLREQETATTRDLIAGDDDWYPDLIIGHSRFSGSFAITMKHEFFRNAQAAYMVHSIPVEGNLLQGYDAYIAAITAQDASAKEREELDAMAGADLVVPVGPLVRAGIARLIADSGMLERVRIHECIGGTIVESAPATMPAFTAETGLKLLFLGRASEPIKGLDDLLMALLEVKSPKVTVDVHYWDDRRYTDTGGERVVDMAAAQDFLDGALGERRANVNIVLKGKTDDPRGEAARHHALIMPSYIEHFGLVPFDALAVGAPVLVNEFSGAGMFIADEGRFPAECARAVVRDFTTTLPRPLRPDDYFLGVDETSFDARPAAWAAAIDDLYDNLSDHRKIAATIQDVLRDYGWRDLATAFVAALTMSGDTRQERGGKAAKL